MTNLFSGELDPDAAKNLYEAVSMAAATANTNKSLGILASHGNVNIPVEEEDDADSILTRIEDRLQLPALADPASNIRGMGLRQIKQVHAGRITEQVVLNWTDGDNQFRLNLFRLPDGTVKVFGNSRDRDSQVGMTRQAMHMLGAYAARGMVNSPFTFR